MCGQDPKDFKSFDTNPDGVVTPTEEPLVDVVPPARIVVCTMHMSLR